MKSLDRILELLNDSKLCNIDDMEREISLPLDRLKEALSFLQEQAFIYKEDEKLRITSMGLRFLKLPLS